jgi:parallel beta-helix repeat protein
MHTETAPKRRSWLLSLAGWLVGPERLVAIGVAVGGGLWAIIEGLPAVAVALIVLAALAVTLAVIHYSLALRDRRHQEAAVKARKSQGIHLENCRDALVEGNYIAGADVGVSAYQSSGSAIRNNRVEGTSQLSGDKNINYGSQEVGINKGVINREVPPSVQVRKIKENEPRGSQFVTTYHVDLTGRPPMLGVAATGSGDIQSVAVYKQGGGGLFGVEEGGVDQGAGYYKTFQDPAPGRYIVEVYSTAAVSGIGLETFESWA